MEGLPWVAAGVAAVARGGTTAAAAAVVGEGIAAVTAGPRLDPPEGGGEERRTRGLKLCPPRVFTMDGLEKEMRGWEEESFKGDGEEMEWLGMKMKEGGGGGVWG